MALTLDKTNIQTGLTIEALQVSQSVDAFTGAQNYDITIGNTTVPADSGSLKITGSLHISGSYNKFDMGPAIASTGYVVQIDDSTNVISKATIAAGSKGAQGVAGDKGAEGSAGPQGATGAGGSTGPQGAIGGSGPAGSQGATGQKGADGATGPQGTIGNTGPGGAKGDVGPQGETGAGGAKGDIGTQGATGAGTQGATGGTGPTGPQGAIGNTGPTGSAGSKGDTGATGPQGAIGTTGPTGPAGAKGDTGATGPQGGKGDNGDKGQKGEIGTQGADGDKGQKGEASSVAGPQGADGAQGTDGTKGDTGSQGDKGTKGEPSSVVGPQGADGVKGDNGASGAKGDLGPQGATGTQGTDGAKGSEGDKGAPGAGGGSDTAINPQVRYIASVLNSGRECQIMSTGTVFGNKTWSRTGSTVTVTSTAHGLTAGDFIVVRGGSDTYLYVTIENVSTNAFDFASGTSGTASGTDLIYIPAAKITSYDEAAGTIQAPSAGNIQINSISLTTGTKTSSTFVLTMPNNITNGGGDNNSDTDMNPPLVGVFKLSDGSFNASGTVSANIGGTNNRFTVGSINTFINNLIRFQF